uniref:BPTI/Kunitz inhibitor domain-containing protein n=1 Tax=Parascaris equorum TaxID=6256 RepID=A0A914R1M5_PAREQ
MPYSVGVLGSQAPAATRWYYDQQTMSCRTFQYNGLKGNQNNFLTQADCESTCHEGNPCLLPRALGTGSGFLQRWYFSSQTGSCQPF